VNKNGQNGDKTNDREDIDRVINNVREAFGFFVVEHAHGAPLEILPVIRAGTVCFKTCLIISAPKT
jgi:hypothetical protein